MSNRFSKARALAVLNKRASDLAGQYQFKRSNGTSQLRPAGREFDRHIERAVAYGKMRAYEDFACAIEENFEFDEPPKEQA